MTSDAIIELQKKYTESQEEVRASGFDADSARLHFAPYLSFVRQFAPPKSKLLDVGCGSGWSTRLLADAGFDATGVDLNGSAFEPPVDDNLRFATGSAAALPFPDSSFEVVTTHEMIEHVPDPKKALDEMLRCLKPGGTLIVVGPNLLSIANCIRTLTVHLWRTKPLRRIFFRVPGMPLHPFGNTIFEALRWLVVSQCLLLGKLVSRQPAFLLREPDTRPPFHADNDACYLCNPVDFYKNLEIAGCKMIQNGKPGRPTVLANLLGGTWIAAQKQH